MFCYPEKRIRRIDRANRTNELAESDLPYLFDRFWQKDPDRSARQHGGLGLSIVRALAQLLDIEVIKVIVSLESVHNFHITLRIRQAEGT